MAESDLLDELQKIRVHMERLDRRDRLRTIGGFFRTMIALIPVILLLYGTWYFAAHASDIIGMVAGEAAKQAAGVMNVNGTGIQNGSINDIIQQYLNQSGSSSSR